MSFKKFKVTKIEENNKKDDKGEINEKVSKKDIEDLYEGETENGYLDYPVVQSRTVVVSLVLGVVAGFVAGIIGIILFFSGSLSFLKVSPEDLLPAQQFKIERNEQVTVLEDERIASVTEDASRSIASIFIKKDVSDNVLNNVYLPSESKGEGFVVTADGWVVTHSKAISDASLNYVVITEDKQILDVDKIVFDDYSGVVFLKVEAKGLITMPLAEGNSLADGERLLVFDNMADNKNDVNVVRLAKKDWQDNSTRANLVKKTSLAYNYLIFDENLNNKYLGSPVVNFSGEVVGLTLDYNGQVLAR